MQLLGFYGGCDYRWLWERRTPAKLASFNFSGKPILYFNRLLRHSENIFNTTIRVRQTNVWGTRNISLRASCRGQEACTHTSAFYIDKNEEERERVSSRCGLRRTAGCLSSAAGCAHHGSGRVYQHRVFNVTTFQLGLVSPSTASDGCSLSGSDSFRSLIPLAPLFARRDRRCERAGRGGCTCNMCVTSYISRVRHTWDGTAGRRRRWISRWQYATSGISRLEIGEYVASIYIPRPTSRPYLQGCTAALKQCLLEWRWCIPPFCLSPPPAPPPVAD